MFLQVELESGPLNRSQTFHHRRLEFSGFDQGDGLATSPDFVSTIGDLFPMAPWGRSSLYNEV
jgi:hypothetical protein